MKNIQKISICFVIILFVCAAVNAQSALDKLILEDARNAYTAKNYKLCLDRITELEQRGNKGLVIAHLKIMATSKISSSSLSLEQIQQFIKDVNYYLENYDNEDFMQQYRDVYEVSKTLKDREVSLSYRMLSKGSELHRAGDRKRASEWYLKAADLDNHNAQYWLAVLYENGQGVEQNLPEAIRWYQLAADAEAAGLLGTSRARNRLGYLYEFGLAGVKKDLGKSLEYYVKSLSYLHLTVAQNTRAGIVYLKLGQPDKAYAWFRKITLTAASLRKSDILSDLQLVRYELGVAYFRGSGSFPRDPSNSFIFLSEYTESAEDSDKNLSSANFLAAASLVLDGLDSQEERFKNLGYRYVAALYQYRGTHERAIKIWEEESLNGDPTAQMYSNLFLAVAYFSGKGVEANKAKAFEHFSKADQLSGSTLRRDFYASEYLDFFRTGFPIYGQDEAKFVKFLEQEHGIKFEAAPPRKPIVKSST